MSVLPVAALAGRPSRAKAIRDPSGDHAGARSVPSTSGPPSVMRRAPVPSGFMTQMPVPPSRNLTKAIFDPSGDQAGSVSQGTDGSLVSPVPSGFVTNRPDRGPPLANAIGPFRTAKDGVPVRSMRKARMAKTKPAAATTNARATVPARRRRRGGGAGERVPRSLRSGQPSGGRRVKRHRMRFGGWPGSSPRSWTMGVACSSTVLRDGTDRPCSRPAS